MQACNSWECVNSFSGWVAAIGTVVTSALALWLSIRDRAIRVSADFSGCIVNAGINPDYHYVISFVNVGVLPVKISTYEYSIKKSLLGRRYRSVVIPTETDFRLSSIAPVSLSYSESAQFMIPVNFMSENENRDMFISPENKLLAFVRIFTFDIFLNTSVGKKLKVKIPWKFRTELWRHYLKIEDGLN